MDQFLPPASLEQLLDALEHLGPDQRLSEYLAARGLSVPATYREPTPAANSEAH
jgi:hypothetical protein